MSELIDLALAVGLAARLTRLAVYDSAGDLLIRRPTGWLASSLAGVRGEAFVEELFSCPFCVGFWLSTAVAVSWSFGAGTALWRTMALAGTISYAVGHMALRLDERGSYGNY